MQIWHFQYSWLIFIWPFMKVRHWPSLCFSVDCMNKSKLLKILKAINIKKDYAFLIAVFPLFLFYKQLFFSTQPQCCLTFSWIELKMLLRCCLTHVTVIKLRQILYLGYLCSCRGLGLFMSYLCNLFFIFSLIFNVINHITSLKQTHYFWTITWMKKVNNFQKVEVQPRGVA